MGGNSGVPHSTKFSGGMLTLGDVSRSSFYPLSCSPACLSPSNGG